MSINLLLNHACLFADIHSHLPYCGQTDVVLKQDCAELRIRVPEWVVPSKILCRVNGSERTFETKGRYISIGRAAQGDKIEIRFALSERKTETDIQSRHYRLILRGSEVVDIYPRGRYSPLYERGCYRSDQTRWRKAERFVSDEEVYW